MIDVHFSSIAISCSKHFNPHYGEVFWPPNLLLTGCPQQVTTIIFKHIILWGM